MSRQQRDAEVIRDFGHGLMIVKARAKYDRRYKMLVCQDADQILAEFLLNDFEKALWFLEGYRMAKAVWIGLREGEIPRQDINRAREEGVAI